MPPAVQVQSVNHWTTREVSRVLNSRLICVIEPVICCRAAIRKDFSLSAGAAGRDISTQLPQRTCFHCYCCVNREGFTLCPWDSPGKNTGVGCHFLLQGIFLTQGSNPSLLHLLHAQANSLPLVPPGKLEGCKSQAILAQVGLSTASELPPDCLARLPIIIQFCSPPSSASILFPFVDL